MRHIPRFQLRFGLLLGVSALVGAQVTPSLPPTNPDSNAVASEASPSYSRLPGAATKVAPELVAKKTSLSSGEAMQSRFGGILVGARFRGGFHPGISTKESSYLNLERGFDMSIGYFPANWGMSFVLPVGGGYEWYTVAGTNENRGPSLEFLGILSLREAGIAGSMAVGYMEFSTRKWLDWKGWAPPVIEKGWFVRPTLGLILPSAFSYLRPSIGYELQSSWTGPSSQAQWENVMHAEIEVGLRLGR